MIVLPAIDLKDGTCVRLRQGEYKTASRVADDPVQTAKRFAGQGAEWLHVVDLDGAKDGKPVNREIIRQIVAQSGMKVEIGGGIRQIETIADYLEGGAARVVLGSAALTDPQLVREAVCSFGEQIAVGIDARNGFVATEGWLRKSTVSYLELAKAMEEAGVRTLIFTDIARDGMLSGINEKQLEALAAGTGCRVIASGGVSSAEDIRLCRSLGLYGCICGKAIYSGTLDLKEAIREGKG